MSHLSPPLFFFAANARMPSVTRRVAVTRACMASPSSTSTLTTSVSGIRWIGSPRRFKSYRSSVSVQMISAGSDE